MGHIFTYMYAPGVTEAAGRLENFENSLALMFVGMIVVFAALVIIGESMVWMGRWFGEKESTSEEKSGSALPVPAKSVSNAGDGLSPQTLAVITAAVFAVAGKSARITRIVPIKPHAQMPWAGAGRMSIQSSHNIRRTI